MTVTIRLASDADVGILASLQPAVHDLHVSRSRGIRDVELSSWSFNTEAHAAFQALGFEPKVVRFGRASF